jgi:serine/threonine-protein kinase
MHSVAKTIEDTAVDTDRNLLFGALALQADLLNPDQFAEACTAWAARKNVALADLLVERSWISTEDKAHIDYLLQRKLDKHGDARASLASIDCDHVQRVMAVLDDPDLARSLAEISGSGSHVILSTLNTPPASRDRYTLTHLHAQGGLGQVWLARDTDLGREVALKELKPERTGHPAVTARFVEEARITSQLQHPGIVPIYELVRHRGGQQPFYTMRFVKGRTLSDAIRDFHQKRSAGKASSLERQVLLRAFEGVCQAVAYAHSHGVLHRDLKGMNVVLGDYGEVIVLDWGLAKLVRPAEDVSDASLVTPAAKGEVDATVEGQVLGTPAYMSPEQASGRHDLVDQRSDVYCLGAILYEILTGWPPFTGSDVQEVLRKVREEEPARPSQVLANVPAALEAVCRKAMAKRPAERYATARELAADVQRYLADEPVSAWREPLRVRSRRWMRRHRLLVTSAVATLAVAAVLLTVMTVALNAKNGELRAANEREVLAREQAEENYNLAREAVEKYLSTVTEDADLKNANFHQLRKKLLQTAVPFFQKLAQQQQADDPVLEAARGRAYKRLASIHNELGEYALARSSYEQMLAIFAQLAADFPDNAGYRQDLGHGHNNLGLLLTALGERAAARQAYRQAMRIHEKLVGDFPDFPEHRKDLANSQMNLGSSLFDDGEYAAARQLYQAAIQIQEKLVAEFPSAPQYRQGLARANHNLANLLGDLGERESARQASRRALQIHKKLAADFPKAPEYRKDLATTYNNIASLLKAFEENTAALEAYRDALRIQEKLVADFPAVPVYAMDLAATCGNVGNLLLNMEQPTEALDWVGKSMTTLRPVLAREPRLVPARNHLRNAHYNRALALEHLHNYTEALKDWDEIIALSPPDRQPSYRLQRTMCLAHTGAAGAAREAFQQAMQVQKSLVASTASLPRERQSLATSLNNLGNILKDIGEPPAARDAYFHALKIQEKLAADFPEVPAYAVAVAASHGNIGGLLLMNDQPREALDWFAKSIAALRPVLARHPNRRMARTYLRNAHWNRARALDDLNRHAEALKEWDEAVAFSPVVEQLSMRLRRAVSLAKAGQLAQVREAYQFVLQTQEKLAADVSFTPRHRVDLAVNLSNLGDILKDRGEVAAGRDAYKNALQLLEKLVGDFPKSREYRRDLARTYNNLGNALHTRGEHAAAREAFQHCLKIHEKLAADFPNAPEHRRDVASSHMNLANLLKTLGQSAEAREAYRHAILIQEKLVADFPSALAYAVDLAGSYGNFGHHLRLSGQPKEALDWFAKSMATLRPVLARQSTLVTARGFLRNAHYNRALALEQLRRYTEALKDWDEAIALSPPARQPAYRLQRALCLYHTGKPAAAQEAYQQAMQAEKMVLANIPTLPAERGSLAGSLNDLGLMLEDMGKLDAARNAYQHAMTIQEKLAADFPTITAYAVDLAGSQGNYGQLLLKGKQPKEALPWFAKSMATLRPVLARQPNQATARRYLRNAHWNQAMALDQLHRHAEALKDWDEALVLSPLAQQPSMRLQRALSLARNGELDKAVAEADQLAAAKNANAVTLYDAACVFAVAVGVVKDKAGPREKYASRAVELLRQAVARGYKNVAHMNKDSDLDALRQREDFKKLIAELEKEKNKSPTR